jgi:hypothetical protein
LVTIMALFLSGCAGAPTTTPGATPARPDEVPAEGVLTLATTADIDRATACSGDAAIQSAVNDYLAKPGRQWTINAARPVGDYVLLWISFPGTADGGIDLIYSTKDQRIHWTFTGGYRG